MAALHIAVFQRRPRDGRHQAHAGPTQTGGCDVIADAAWSAAVHLITKRAVLRPWCREDLPAFFDIYSREEITRWLGEHPRKALVDEVAAAQSLQRWIDTNEALKAPLGLWAIVPSTDGMERAPIGTVLLLPLREADQEVSEIEIGWHLHPQAHGSGWATEAAARLLQAASDAGLRRVLALVEPANEPSHRVARRLGLEDEGLSSRWFGVTAHQYVWRPPPD